MHSKSTSVQPIIYTNLVFEGCTTSRLEFAGAIKALSENNKLEDIQKVAGTSTGSIAALLLALGYNSDKCVKLLEDFYLVFPNPKEIDLSNNFNLPLSILDKWLDKIIGDKIQDTKGNAKPNATFTDFNNMRSFNPNMRELYIIGYSAVNVAYEIYHYSPKNRSITLKEAIKNSLEITTTFAAFRYNASLNRDVPLKGNMFDNFPIAIFDKDKEFNPKTLCIALSTSQYNSKDNQSLRGNSLITFEDGSKLSIVNINAITNVIKHKDNYEGRTIFIDSNDESLENSNTIDSNSSFDKAKKLTAEYIKSTSKELFKISEQQKTYKIANRIIINAKRDSNLKSYILIQYIFKDCSFEQLNECFELLKIDNNTIQVTLSESAVDKELKMISLKTTEKVAQEILSLDEQSELPKVKQRLQLSLNLIELKDWKKPDIKNHDELNETKKLSKELIKFVEYRNITKISILLKKGASPNYKDHLGRTALHHASDLGEEEIVELLIKYNSDVNISDHLLDTPLHIATSQGYCKIVKYLITSKANLDAQNIYGSRPIEIAISDKKVDIIKLLVESDTSLTKEDYQDYVPFTYNDNFTTSEPSIPTTLNTKGQPNQYFGHKVILDSCFKILKCVTTNAELAKKIVEITGVKCDQSSAKITLHNVDKIAFHFKFNNANELQQFINYYNTKNHDLICGKPIFSKPLTQIIFDSKVFYDNLNSIFDIKAQQSNNTICSIM